MQNRVLTVWFIALASALAWLLTHWLRPDQRYEVPWLMTGVTALASLYGLPGGLLAGGVALGLEAATVGASDLPWLGLVLLVSALLGNRARLRLDVVLRRQSQTTRQLTLLVGALEDLSHLTTREAVFAALPELLQRQGEGHASIWVPSGEGFRPVAFSGTPHLPGAIAPTGVVGRAYATGQTQYVADVHKDPGYIPATPASGGSELALPLREGEQVVAVLNLERREPFPAEERQGLERFAHAVSAQLARLSERLESELLNRLAVSLASIHSPRAILEQALEILMPTLGVQHGGILMQQGARMVLLASRGTSSVQASIPFSRGLVWQVYRSGRPVFIESASAHEGAALELLLEALEGLVLHPVPLPGGERQRVVLYLGDERPRLWRQSERDLLQTACRTVGLALETALIRERLEGLLHLARDTVEAPPAQVYQQVLEAAVRLVPGAEKGSLLVRKGEHFYFQAVVGFDLEALAGLHFNEADHLRWYGEDRQGWLRGEPRIVTAEEVSIAQISRSTAPDDTLERVAAMDRMQANLTLPIPYRGEVLALLNLDNFHDPAAFDAYSKEVARSFSTPVAAILHEVRNRNLLEEAALTDALTGLPNRRAFDRRLSEELERAKRHGYPLSLLVMDLRGFKQVNDRLGHARGDEALVRVAQALLLERRKSDSLFRWGGDEFAAILPHADSLGGLSVAQRYASLVETICLEGLCMGLNIGVATFPEEANSQQTLLQLADSRMYRAKEQGVAVLRPS
ncbi:Diguanylate cyclase DosC [Calidithermus terrae]|uniref:Diguanylate cyclase DosC n=1 Tax=Calidithermus terrae TaxID=1408545 RepID=A0A399F3F0_9DEIN|nr:diguanylate cyclase [Calidithermus terrae]RIH90315.1 Diguanylate cyclase DosC [Calidithermus terrae]